MGPEPEGQVPEESSNLEDRLRGLILNNARSDGEVEQAYTPISPGYLPSHWSNTKEKERAEYLKKESLQNSPSTSVQASQSARGGRKRPNQAQRRQLSTQNSIPVDAMPVAPSPYSSPPVFSPSNFSPRTQHYVQQGQSRSQSSHHGPYTERVKHEHTFTPPMRHHNQISPSTRHQTRMQPYSGYGHHQIHSNVNKSTLPKDYHQYMSENIQSQSSYNFNDRPPPNNTALYHPGPYNTRGRGLTNEFTIEQIAAQITHLEALITTQVPNIAIDDEEISVKEAFRASVESVCRTAIDHYERTELHNINFHKMSVELKCFGSMASGFATKASDMDLALFTPESNPAADSPESPIPRLIEKELLSLGYGARLLTRTRVPIIKLCQKPPVKLLSDLLQEREKWENGFDDENEEDREDAVEDKDIDNGTMAKPCSNSMKDGEDKSSMATYKTLLASLKQMSKQSLGDYYGFAKRILRKLGARDVSSAYSTTLSVDEVKVLADVCRAFLNGLSDEALKARLLKYDSVSVSVGDQPEKIRSLSSIYMQMEGERLAMSHDKRPLHEATDRAEADFIRQIQNWQSLLNITDAEPLAYGRMLHQAVEALKKIPSLKLLFLEQGLREDSMQYHARALRIANDLSLNGKTVSNDDNHVNAVVVAQYIAGVRKSHIQDALQAIASQDQTLSLESLLIKHRTLELVDDYEIALSKNFYDEVDRSDIEQYIRYLRNGILGSTIESSLPTVAEPISTNTSIKLLIAKVRNLPDPGIIARKVRDKYKDHLEFPKTDVGVLCDINFSAHLGIHNTQLLRCYSLTDARVKPLILFIKFWAKTRGVNTPYRGTLSSYGYVLMMLHYLINVVKPFVCPNLQILRREPPPYLTAAEIAREKTCNGYDVAFWRNEKEIAMLANSGKLNYNHDPLGKLLRGFFEYFANLGPLSSGGRGFDWGRDVLSLRTPGGLLSKQEKGWVGARTVMETTNQAGPAPSSASVHLPKPSDKEKILTSPQSTAVRRQVVKQETKEIRHRFLFAIEDPFETDHNVARTVTHDGIIAVRDELRRAWQIIKKVGTPKEGTEGVLDAAASQDSSKNGFQELIDLLHGIKEVEAKAEN